MNKKEQFKKATDKMSELTKDIPEKKIIKDFEERKKNEV